MPLGLAVPTFLYYNFHGIREQGLIGYIKHFAGPIWWMAWLMFPIEIVSHLARMMSLTIRLYANMFAGDLVTLVFFSLIPDWRSGDLPGTAHFGFGDSGVRVHAADDDLSLAGSGARALKQSSVLSSQFSVLAFSPRDTVLGSIPKEKTEN